MKKNPAFENSLACLQHPLTLLSIAVLLLNDHVLKIISPSWWTGKLSDFAGLFFFPFIVAAGLSLALSKFNLSRQRIGQVAFGFVAVWFALLKTVPFVNSLTAQVASVFIGGPTRLVMDWADLMALASMWPAWLLWQKQSGVVLSRKAYISLAVGVLACLATSPALPPFEDVTALAYQDGFLYARSSTPYEYYFMQSDDRGETWEEDWITRVESLEHERKLPIRACDPADLQNCYQVDGTDEVATSLDGGKSWQVAWEIPAERREYVARISGEFATYDLIIVQEGDARFLFVARGRNGILRRQLPDGEWVQLGVEEAQPTPFYAYDIPSAIAHTRNEFLIWLGLVFLVVLIIQAAVWNSTNQDKNIRDLIQWLTSTVIGTVVILLAEFLLPVGVSVILIAAGSAYSKTLEMWLVAIATAISILTPFTWLLLRTRKWISKMVIHAERRPRMFLYSALIVVGVLLIGYLPWPLWALGTIERYQWALFISISVSVLITMLGYRLIRNAK